MNKLATKAALRQAAARLLSEQGYEATTVRQIAHAANVGERTFYRYFDGKDDLLAQEALGWIDDLRAAILGRPADEAPYQAVARAMVAAAGQITAGTGHGGAWILADSSQPLALLRQVTPRPLRRLEQAIAEAVLPRISAAAGDGGSSPAAGGRGSSPAVAPEFRAQIVARIASAALRTAAGWHRELARGDRGSPGIAALLDDAFAQVTDLTSAPQP